MKNEIIIFENQSVKLEVNMQDETVWLSLEQMTSLFGRDRTVIARHINNIFKSEELDKNEVCAKFAHTTLHGAVDGKTQTRELDYYNLDMIISVGYRVNSKNGIAFRQWANRVLKDYLIKGYAINEKRLLALEKTISIQTKMLSSVLNIEEKELLRAINEYTNALTLLDEYDHQVLKKPKGNEPIYKLAYEDCVKMVDKMKNSFNSEVFGVEKERGKVEGIIASIYQSAFGEDAYPSLEEKAANLLYFMIKDHPYADGCKRIAASLFLLFLDKNNALFVDGRKNISDSALVAMTLLIAQSDPREKEVMIKLVMNFLNVEVENI